MIRPQNKKRKELMNFRSNLKKGDTIITQGGIHGSIVSISDSTVTISVDANTKLKVEKEFFFKFIFYCKVRNMLKVGITGGIGSGKSTVSSFFQN